VSILEMVPVWDREGVPEQVPEKTWACWTPSEGEDRPGESHLVYDLRDWRNQLPAGSRWRTEGMIGGER
jgi:CRISPR system Cascade subunit CasD